MGRNMKLIAKEPLSYFLRVKSRDIKGLSRFTSQWHQYEAQ